METSVSVFCLGLCPSAHCILIDISPGINGFAIEIRFYSDWILPNAGPRILVDCPIEPAGLASFPVLARGNAKNSSGIYEDGSGAARIHTCQVNYLRITIPLSRAYDVLEGS